METYHNTLKKILNEGSVSYEPRTQEYILGISGEQTKFDLREGFPLVTTKNVPLRLPAEELFWKLRGERNVKSLVDRNVNIWTANAFDKYLRANNLEKKIPKHTPKWNEEYERYSARIKNDEKFAKKAGDLGPVYGYIWGHSPVKKEGISLLFQAIKEILTGKKEEIDQVSKLIERINSNPGSRYHILTAWDTDEVPKGAIGPCPFWDQFSVWGNYMDLHEVQRSDDIFLGDPFNKAEGSLLLKMIADETGYEPRYFIHTSINTHTYLGVPPRASFWLDNKNVENFRKELKKIEKREGYLELKDWYLKRTPEESEGNERKDHIPFILEQLSKEPRERPKLKVKKDVSLFEKIKMPAQEVFDLEGYEPHRWASKAEMAA